MAADRNPIAGRLSMPAAGDRHGGSVCRRAEVAPLRAKRPRAGTPARRPGDHESETQHADGTDDDPGEQQLRRRTVEVVAEHLDPAAERVARPAVVQDTDDRDDSRGSEQEDSENDHV